MRLLDRLRLLLTLLAIPAVCTGVTVQLRGAGASFPLTVYKIWIPRYKLLRSPISINMSYDVIGSNNGKNRIKEFRGHPVEYAGTDIALSDSDYKKYPDLKIFPTMAGAIVLGYNLPGVNKLRLTGENLAGIYNGSIRWWNDTDLTVINPDVVLPDQPICVLARRDKSGSTHIFTKALSAFSPDWARRFGVFSPAVKEDQLPWDRNVIRYYGQSTRGMAGILLSLHYCVGYLSVGDAHDTGVQIASLFNKDGYEVEANVTTVQHAMDNFAHLFDEELAMYLADPTGKLSYPISQYTYIVIHTQMESCDSAAALYRYVEWFLLDETATEICISKKMVPLSKSVTDLIFDRVLNKMTCGAERKMVTMVVQEEKLAESRALETWRTPVYVGVPITAFVLLILTTYIVYQQFSINRAIFRQDWRIPENRIQLIRGGNNNMRSGISLASEATHSVGKESLFSVESKTTVRLGRLNGKIVMMTPILIVPELNVLRRRTQKTLIWFQESVNHINVVRFYGLTRISQSYVITGFCQKGTLQDVLYNEKYNLDTNFKFSISMDIAAGMTYLHKLGVIHGYLSTATCYIDSRWNVKVANWEFLLIAVHQNRPLPTVHAQFMDDNIALNDKNVTANHQFWTAPELLLDRNIFPTKSSDVYSFGVSLVEVFSRNHPFDSYLLNKEPKDIISAIRLSGVRPEIKDDVPKALIGLITECWDSIPNSRPNFSAVEKSLKKANPTKKGVMDCMMEAMEEYVLHLEEKVSERTTELNTAMKSMETLLHKILPPSVADALSKGQTVPPESFDSVTVYFSDIVSFTTIAAESSPLEIVDLLNDLYTAFDDIIDQHDVYKVETIGDAYMCISGLPQRNGTMHVAHIANMALDLAIAAHKFKMRHRPNDRLRIRVGLHSGPVVAGVVGMKMPRYCLFGDTVNTASRMESNSKPMKIHMTKDSKKLLDAMGGYKVRKRGIVDIKGKGHMDTYWLIGRDGLKGSLPEELLRDDSILNASDASSLTDVVI